MKVKEPKVSMKKLVRALQGVAKTGQENSETLLKVVHLIKGLDERLGALEEK